MKLSRVSVVLVWVVAVLFQSTVYGDPHQPQQVHLSFGDDPTKMIVVWNTPEPTPNASVEYGQLSSASRYANATMTKFVDGGSLHHVQYIYRAIMTGLVPGTKYYYRCGSKYGKSQVFSFSAMRNGTDWSPRILLFGDLGVLNGRSLPRIKNDVTKNHYDAIFHVGDFAYDLQSANGTVGDMFMNLMEPIAANFSYMTCPGNHEYAYNFSNYRNRFSMPGDEYGEKMFYSFNIGPAHIISFSSEYYYFLQFGSIQMFNQYYWLMEDLEEASRPENRRQRPWIITMAHRPMYCSNSDSDDCTRRESLIRTGIPFFHILGLEKLFNSYGVDLMIWAHEHSYERLWPLYDRKVYNGTKSRMTTRRLQSTSSQAQRAVMRTWTHSCRNRQTGQLSVPMNTATPGC
ncbi:hypothetical protein ScPMuIL_014838 [Solemya velum]